MWFRRKRTLRSYDDLANQLATMSFRLYIDGERSIDTDMYTLYLSVKYGGGYNEMTHYLDPGSKFSMVISKQDLKIEPILRYSCDECGAGTGTLITTVNHLRSHAKSGDGQNTIQTGTIHVLA